MELSEFTDITADDSMRVLRRYLFASILLLGIELVTKIGV